MCTLKNLTRVCGQQLPPGTKAKLYLIPKDELTAWPATVADGGGVAAGDTKRLDEAFAMVTTAGKGFWRTLDILVDTGQLREVLEGEIGGQSIRQRVDFFVLGNGAEQNEYVDCMLANSGCLIVMIPTKAGNYHVMGDLENPVYVEAIEGGSGGDRVGFQYTLYSNTGSTTYLYDADTLGIDPTPAT